MSIVYSITALSLQTASTAMRRFDHAPFFSMQKSEYTIPFYVKVLTRYISLTDKYIVLLEWSLTRGSWRKDKVVDRPKQVKAESSWRHDIFHFLKATARLVGVNHHGRRSATSWSSDLRRVHLPVPWAWKRRGAERNGWKWEVSND